MACDNAYGGFSKSKKNMTFHDLVDHIRDCYIGDLLYISKHNSTTLTKGLVKYYLLESNVFVGIQKVVSFGDVFVTLNCQGKYLKQFLLIDVDIEKISNQGSCWFFPLLTRLLNINYYISNNLFVLCKGSKLHNVLKLCVLLIAIVPWASPMPIL
jgi:hypothetical protein